jgi:hypothetical protein
MTHYTQSDVDIADRHIAQGERHIVQQEALLTRLRMQEHPTEEAERFLALLNLAMVEHLAHRSAMRH